MGKYITKPQTIDAMQYTGSNFDEIEKWAGDKVNYILPEDRTDDPECDAELLSSANSNWIGIYKSDWIVFKNGLWMRVNDKTFRENYREIK